MNTAKHWLFSSPVVPEHARIRPSQLKSFSHQKAAKNFIVYVSLFGKAYDCVFQF